MNFSIVLAYAAALTAAGLAAGWLALKHRTLAHWSFGLGLLVLAADTALAGVAAGELTSEGAAGWQAWRTCCAAVLPGIWLLHSLCYSRGNSAEFLARWRWGLALAVLVPVTLARFSLASGIVEAPEGLVAGGRMWSGFLPLDWAGKALEMAMLLGMLLALVNLEKTFRSALGLMRWRVKFVVLGLAVTLGGRIYASSQAVLFSGIELSLVGVLGASLLVGILLAAFSFVRTGLEEIDVYPSPAMLYGSLSVLLAGSYLLVVGLLAEAVVRWGGDRDFPLESLLLLLAIVALAVLFMSDRFRQHVQLFISRHLRRPFYDYRQVWTAFTARTASRLDLAEYCRAVVTLMAETFNALSVTMWVADVPRQRLEFGASTSLRDGGAPRLLAGETAGPVLAALAAEPRPFDLGRSAAGWARSLETANPNHFHKGGGRWCVPLVAAGQCQGAVLLGDRVGGKPFTPEDTDLFTCIGDQVAAGLLNLQLSCKLVEVRELEAFQAMSTFFVHDLKNTASTLSMMLQNLPVHFHNPDFRADALRGIAKSVERLNGLVERLTSLRHGLAVHPVPTDLNQLVAASLEQFQGAPGPAVACQLGHLPRVPVDPHQFPKILANLVLNAREAAGTAGTIEVATSSQDRHAVVSVRDNGPGMSAEFINRRLFRPFQTTKKKGLGIGLFQSRMIAEAHGGRIEVESEPGHGTTFRLLLPLALVRQPPAVKSELA